jgi:hypothetical protein
MGDESELLTTGPGPREISNRSILVLMGILIVSGAAACSLAIGVRFGLGVLLGGALALLNYFWLDSSLKALFGGESTTRVPLLALKYVLRYVVIGAVLFLVYVTDVVPVVSVIAGLASFAIAVVIQGLKNIFISS